MFRFQTGMDSTADEWVGEDTCLFPSEDLEPLEAQLSEELDAELRGCSVQVGPHKVAVSA